MAPKQLWAPWRMEYIAAPKPSRRSCLFCDIREDGPRAARRNLVVEFLPGAFVLMNRYPYTSGHLMVVPHRHAARLARLGAEERRDLFEAVARAEELLARCLRWEGLNVGMNIGEAAGAGIASHLHVHLVPRWNGDTNYMTTTGQVRVIPQHIRATWALLRAEAGRLAK